jgi:hypothetical protein
MKWGLRVAGTKRVAATIVPKRARARKRGNAVDPDAPSPERRAAVGFG